MDDYELEREKIALFRHSVIGPLISAELSHGDLKRTIRQLSERTYDIPGTKRVHIGAGTIQQWLYNFRTKGFDALKPKPRKDRGSSHCIRPELEAEILARKRQHPKVSVKTTLRLLLEKGLMKPCEVSKSSVYRLLCAKLPKAPPTKTGNEQRRFSHAYANDCWQGDCMHGPYIRIGEETTARKTYLIAFLDDATRFIVGAQFFFSEAAANVKEVLRCAILTYGIPRKLYLDNGRNFSTHDLQVAMATLNCALIHATAYYPEGKGKIERFFRTVQSAFLPTLSRIHSLESLNANLESWIDERYNRDVHSALVDRTPHRAFMQSTEKKPLRRIPPSIDPVDLFCTKVTRLVAKDGTFRINSMLYESQEHLIGCAITVAFDKDDPSKKVKVFDGSVFVHTATPIDFLGNANAKRRPRKPFTSEENHG